MKVFVDGIVFGRQGFGGISRVWAEYLTALPTFGVEVEVVLPIVHRNQFLRRSLGAGRSTKIRRDWFSKPARLFDFLAVRSAILKACYLPRDAEVFHSSYYTTVYGANLTKLVTVYDMIPEHLSGVQQDLQSRRFLARKYRAIQNADAVVVISETVREDLWRFMPSTREKRTYVVPLGVSHKVFSAKGDLDAIAHRYSLPITKERYFLIVGRRGGYKNFKLVRQLVRTYPGYEEFAFVCVGGEQRGQTDIREEDLSSRARFYFIDYVEDGELAILYRNARALINPSRFEGFSLPLLEAMTCECPIVCSDIPAHREIGGDAVMFFDPLSAASLHATLTDCLTGERQVALARGRERASQFSWEVSVAELVRVYRQQV